MAAEVKRLATRIAKAARDIGGEIATLQTAAREVLGAIGPISSTTGALCDIATTTTAAEQGAAPRKIARNVELAAYPTHDVSRAITDIARAATQAGAASSDVPRKTSDVVVSFVRSGRKR